MKTILVTGGNRGIGKEICRQLAAQGHTVFLGSRDLDKGRNAAREIPGQVHPIPLDTASPDSIRQAAAQIGSQAGHLDVLINNAGVFSSTQGALAVEMEEVHRVLEVNLFGVWNTIRAFVPLMEKGKAARVVSLSSQMGQLHSLKSGGYAAYRLSKASLNTLTMLLTPELQARGIAIAAMCPGWVQTDMGGSSAPLTVEQGADTATWLATLPEMPTGKFWSARRESPW